ncbi:E3 ubiquitin-protein ligase ATL6-like [Telopea speciosissima]|uniref:E3 ubiquitin-protein ligase ATL6-like n=1 Tax=Telopea speciosissima TaxID=54955 RepID=UPI001CC5773F|nr:E3 ubiquitin-protein ligase ATL6-like [Telopea speciosissima]
MRNELKQNQSHRSILDLFHLNPATQNERLICIYLFLMFRFLPYSAAQSSNQPSPVVLYNNGYPFNPSVVIIIIVIVSAFLTLFFISVCLHRCYRIENDGNTPLNDVEGRISRRDYRGLNPALMENLPTFAYSHVKDHKLGNGALECVVCLTEFEDEDKIRLLPTCDHVFHAECIDAWLSKRTTCPVCRANLVPLPAETPATIVPVHDIEGDDSDGEIPISEPVEVENEQVSVDVINEEPQVGVTVAMSPEVINQTPMQNRTIRSMKPRYAGRFPRSHSTGHSLVQPGEDVERFTLRLPEDVRKQIMKMRQLKRTRSMEALPGLQSPRKGYRVTDESSSRGGKSIGEKPEGWVFSRTPPFIMKAFSPRSPKMIAEGDVPVTPPRPKPFRSPLRVCKKADGTELSLIRSPV